MNNAATEELQQRLLKKDAKIKELVDALVHIQEYWNGGVDSAVDAADEARLTAITALNGMRVPTHVHVPQDLFEWLVEYAIELKGLWWWKRGRPPRNDNEWKQLEQHVEQAVALRDAGKNHGNSKRP